MPPVGFEPTISADEKPQNIVVFTIYIILYIIYIYIVHYYSCVLASSVCCIICDLTNTTGMSHLKIRRPGLRYVDNIEKNLQVIGLGIELMWHKGRFRCTRSLFA